MFYRDFCAEKVSALGFGMMRLPMTSANEIDEPTTRAMVERYIAAGGNYFDTAFPYLGGKSELVLGRCLAGRARDSFFVATKYPGHQTAEYYDPAEVFEKQLVKLGLDYIDFYMLHNVCGFSVGTYTDPQWGIVDYFVEQRRLGRIKHLGFSTHADTPLLGDFLERYGEQMDFCQIQFNYLDYSLQDARGKYELLSGHGIPVAVMEPVRGGKLAQLPEQAHARLQALRPGLSDAAWCFSWLARFDNAKILISGMSSMEQMEDNLRTFEKLEATSVEEDAVLYAIAEELKDSVPCTSCRYCCDDCPVGLDIPGLIDAYNDLKLGMNFTPIMFIENLPADKQPNACLGCGACTHTCPQGIDIPDVLDKLTTLFAESPHWSDLCAQREAERKALEGK